MSVEELIRRLQECDPTAKVSMNDDAPLAEIEAIETDDGPCVELWDINHIA